MPSKSKLENAIASDAAFFGIAANELSDRLERLQVRLSTLPAKAETTVSDGQCSLTFCRHQGDWTLLVSMNEGGGNSSTYILTKATIEIKATAARLVPELIKTIANKFARQREMVELAVNALNEADLLLNETKMGGE